MAGPHCYYIGIAITSTIIIIIIIIISSSSTTIIIIIAIIISIVIWILCLAPCPSCPRPRSWHGRPPRRAISNSLIIIR